MNDDQLHTLCLQWQHWRRTRRLLGAPPVSPPNLLSKLVPHAGGGSGADGPMSATLAAFDLAVRSMPETVDKYAFMTYYARHLERADKPIKAVAEDLGISRKTFYKGVKRARADLYATALRFQAALTMRHEDDPEAASD
jgi:DNA-binding phage protein